jgi:uncharacterized surface protein with fasciclin (FAS1) repeats
VGSSALVRMIRLINEHVVPNPKQALEDMTGTGVAKTYGGEYVRWDNGKVFTSGNMDSVTLNSANTLEYKKAANGTVFYIDRLLTYTDIQPGRHLQKLGADAASPYNYFWQYLSNSSMYTASSGEIAGISAGVFYTIFAPTKEAILEAVRDGYLPGTIVNGNPVPNFKPTTFNDKELVNRFIQYHILNKTSVATDGENSGAYETFFKNANTESTSVFVNNLAVNAMSLTDMHGRNSNVLLGQSNYLSNRVTIHLINNYLQYRY